MAKDNIEIIYEDQQIIAINKPAGISVTADRTGKMNLIDFLQIKRKEEQDLKIVHRLDKGTSGIMILAKNTDAQRKFSEYFEKGQVRKTYLAIITGLPSEKTGMIDAPIMQGKKNSQIMEVDFKKGKDAQTKWELLANFGNISLIAARPITGRTHQIRIHFQYAGMPLAIDPLYGQNQAIMLSSFKANYKLGKYEEEKPLIDRLTLCAYQLEIENLHLIAPLEKKFKATIKMLTKYNPNGLDAFVEKDNLNRLLDSQPLLLQI
ncbi:MAG: RNA pseudouridine synthase [Phycisphaerae bacterium]|nr:RNA pseudouridine synthase [Phycisphaerae bacterium]